MTHRHATTHPHDIAWKERNVIPLTRRQRRAKRQRAVTPPLPGVCSYRRNRQRRVVGRYDQTGHFVLATPAYFDLPDDAPAMVEGTR